MQDNQSLTVILFGLQGSGKGTQAQLLKEYLDTHTHKKTLYLETGQLLRNFTEKQGYTSELVAQTLSKGGLLPSFMPVFVLGTVMVNSFTGQEHLIFDGATRRVNQSVMLDSMLRFYNRTPYHLVLIDLEEDVAIERLQGRGRKDDTVDSIKKRIAWSKEHMASVIQQFESFDCTIHRVDGSPSIEEVHQSILKTLGLQ